MQIHKVAVPFGNIPLGTKVWLTDAQASARAHLLTPTGEKAVIRKVKAADGEIEESRKLYVADAQLGFKAGEELAVEGDVDRGIELLFGIENKAGAGAKKRTTRVETPQSAAARTKSAKDKAAGTAAAKAGRVASAEAELKAAEVEAAEAQRALLGADESGKAAAEKRHAKAREALAAAQQKLAKARAD